MRATASFIYARTIHHKSYERLNLRNTKYKLKYPLDLDCFEMGNCHPSKTNVNKGFASVDIDFLGMTISYVTLSYSQYLYNTEEQKDTCILIRNTYGE